MNIRHPAIIASVLLVVLALVVFGISVYVPIQSEELTKYLVIFGFAIIGVAAVVSGWKDLYEFIAKLLGKKKIDGTSFLKVISGAGTTNRSVAVDRDLTGTTFTGDIHGNVIVSSSPQTSDQPTAKPSNSSTTQPNLVHPYALQANFTGRVNERKELAVWLADDTHPIYALVAMGGMGKSALAWYWLTQDILKSEIENRKLDGVMWWSFYEGEASFSKFINEALEYVTGQPIDAAHLPTIYDRALELRRELQSNRVLFVLDGFERQLRAYARLDAAYQRDDVTDPSREARACVEPDTARLLKDIAAGTTSAKVLITSRLMVSDLEDRAGDPLAGVLYRELKELGRDDAVAFMHAQGVVKGTSAEIANVCEADGYHPLSLRLLSGLIARDMSTPGDIAAAPRHDVHADLVARQHHILEQSYNALPDKERALISRIAAFRNPMTYEALTIFNEFGSAAKFDVALNDLHVRGLLQRDTARNRYDLHPIVRHYCYDRLTDKKRIHNRLRKYFSRLPMPDLSKVNSLGDLTFGIELYHHTVRAGRYNEAAELLENVLYDLLYFRFGAYQLTIELLRALFPNGEDNSPAHGVPQGWAMNSLANSYSLYGQPRYAVTLFERLNALLEKMGNKQLQPRGLGNIAYMAQILIGHLKAAERNLQRVIDLCSEINDKGWEAVGHYELGHLYTINGRFKEAEQQFSLAFETKSSNKQGQGLIWSYRAFQALLTSDARAALEAAQHARTLADEYHVERDIIQAEWLWGVALIEEGKDLRAAATHLSEVLTRCRSINLAEFEPDILLAWARWHRACSNALEAQAHAEEALAIADRCEYRLKQADIHNFLARLALDDGNRVVARQQAEIAKERAWCDGPPHCYKPALDEAERVLKEIG